jgi:hypothetical protein
MSKPITSTSPAARRAAANGPWSHSPFVHGFLGEDREFVRGPGLDGDIIFPRGNGALRFAEDCKTYGPRLATDLLDHEGPQNQPIGHKPRSLPSEPLPEAA